MVFPVVVGVSLAGVGVAVGSRMWYSKQANTLAKGNGVPSEQVEAIAHSLTSASLTYDFNRKVAKFLGDANEVQPWNHPDAEFKDQFNNEVGRRIGDYAKAHAIPKEKLDDLIVDAYKNDFLIAKNNDSRTIHRASPLWTEPSKEWVGASKGRSDDVSYSDFLMPSSTPNIPKDKPLVR